MHFVKRLINLLILVFLEIHLLPYVLHCNTKTDFAILQFGADPTGKSLTTSAIQAAIDSCFRSGGGYVTFPTGKYLTGTIVLKDNVYLNIEPGATILGSKNIDDYDPKYLVYAKGAKNFGIIGKGTINGQGDAFWRGKQRPYIRPNRTIKFEFCEDALIEDIHIRNSASWCIDFENCDYVTIRGVHIVNDRDSPNTDGIDPVSSSNVFISDCYIETGDDCICPKSSNPEKPCENIVVTNCVLISDDSAIKCGTRSNGAIRNCTFSNIVIRNSDYGLAFFMKDGGIYENIQFSNINIETTNFAQLPSAKSSKVYPIFMDIEGRDESVALGRIRNITFSDIHITTVNGNCVFLGMPDHFIENITLDNVRMHVLERGDLSTRHKPRGNRKIKYKAVNDYAHIHAHFTIAYAKGFNVRNLYIQDETDSELFERTCIWCLNVSDLVIENFQNQQTFFNKTNPFIHLTNCKGAQIRHCLPQATDAGFVKIEGEKSSKISLIGNDLSQHAQPILLGNDVKQSILYKINNRIK